MENISNVRVDCAKYDIIRGSSYIHTPKHIYGFISTHTHIHTHTHTYTRTRTRTRTHTHTHTHTHEHTHTNTDGRQTD